MTKKEQKIMIQLAYNKDMLRGYCLKCGELQKVEARLGIDVFTLTCCKCQSKLHLYIKIVEKAR